MRDKGDGDLKALFPSVRVVGHCGGVTNGVEFLFMSLSEKVDRRRKGLVFGGRAPGCRFDGSSDIHGGSIRGPWSGFTTLLASGLRGSINDTLDDAPSSSLAGGVTASEDDCDVLTCCSSLESDSGWI